MTPENFCYWLQGCLELTNAKELTEAQVALIKEHLNLVFEKRTGGSDIVTRLTFPDLSPTPTVPRPILGPGIPTC